MKSQKKSKDPSAVSPRTGRGYVQAASTSPLMPTAFSFGGLKCCGGLGEDRGQKGVIAQRHFMGRQRTEENPLSRGEGWVPRAQTP